MIEREWREASDMRRSTVTLAAILAIAAALRFWRLGAGIPYNIGVDEPEIMDRAVHMMKSGDFNPHFFHYPGLYIYVQMAVATLRFLAGATAGEWRSLAEVVPTDFLLWGRAVTATMGTLTVLLVYQAAMRWGTRYALFAATLMAVMPLHVRESHFVLNDVPVTFFVALCFVFTLRASEQPKAAAFAWAGVAAGLAAATKYTGAVVIVLPLIAVWMTPAARPSRITAAMAVVGGAAVAFLFGAPYTLLDLPAFLNGYADLAGSYSQTPAQPGWWTAFRHLQKAFEWPATIAVLSGIVFAIVRSVRGPGRVRWTVAVTFPVLYFWFVSRQSLIFGRYLLPLLPFVCVLAAAAVVSGVSLLRRFSIPRQLRTGLIVALTVLALAPPAWTSFQFNRNLGGRGSVVQAYEWIMQNIPAGSKIAIECRPMLLPGGRFDQLRVVQLRRHPFEYYREQNVEYLIASSQCYGTYLNASQTYPREYSEYMHIFGQSREIVRFEQSTRPPSPEIRILKVRP